MSGAHRPLILGALSGLPVDSVEPFARSLRATGFTGRLSIVAAGYDAVQLKELEALSDHVHTVDEEYGKNHPRTFALLRQIRGTRGLRRIYPRLFEEIACSVPEPASSERWKSMELHLEGLQSLRYTHYYRYLLEDAVDVDSVMITDLRDVIFQRDPFAAPVTGLELYLEDDSVRIGVDAFNTRWLCDLFGRAYVDAMRGRPVSCSGTVFGTRDAMMKYLSEMMTSIARRRRPMGPHDQGIHNALIQDGRLPQAQVVPNEQGRVLTLGRMKSPRVDDDGLLLNVDGRVPAVVHQWDRHPQLVPQLRTFRTESVRK